MSRLILPGATGLSIMAASDGRLASEEWADTDGIQPAPIYGALAPMTDFLGIDDWATEWWPGPGQLQGDLDASVALITQAAYFQRVYPNAGANGRFGFSGTTRDQYGSPLPGAVVRCYRVLDGSLQAQVTSDPNNGSYIITSPYSDAHFLTVHYGGTVAGATVDTLTPS